MGAGVKSGALNFDKKIFLWYNIYSKKSMKGVPYEI